MGKHKSKKTVRSINKDKSWVELSQIHDSIMPSSEEIVAVTKKKISNKKAMSAMEPEFTWIGFLITDVYSIKRRDARSPYAQKATIHSSCES